MIKISLKKRLVFTLLALTTVSFAGNDNFPAGARSSGISNASVMLTDFWAISHNQAGLVFVNDLAFGVSYQRGFIPSLSENFAGVVLPLKKSAFAFSTSYYGYSEYYEMKSGLAYSMYLGKNLSAGVQMDYFHTYITGVYDNSRFLTFEVGLIYQLTDQVTIGFHAFNPFYFQLFGRTNDVTSTIRLGVGYELKEGLLLAAELENDAKAEMNVKIGVELSLVERFFLRAGAATYPRQLSFGMGYLWDNFDVSLSVYRHHILGYKPGVSIHYRF